MSEMHGGVEKPVTCGVSVIIPVKNVDSEPYLPFLLSKLLSMSLTEGVPIQILVQDEAGLTNAVITGVKNAVHPVIAVMDADGSHSPRHLFEMLKVLEEADVDVVVGSRYCEGGSSEDSFFRKVVSRLYTFLTRFLLKTEVRDPLSGFVVGKRELFRHLKPHMGFKFLLQILAFNPKPCVAEMPIFFVPRGMGKSTASLKQGWITLKQIFSLWRTKKRC